MPMKTYRVDFAIDVEAETSVEACKRAWELMTQPDSLPPVGTILDISSGERQDIDLQELVENKALVTTSFRHRLLLISTSRLRPVGRDQSVRCL